MTRDERFRGAEHPRVFRAPSAVVGLVVAAIATLVLLGDAVVRAGFGSMLLLAPWILMGLWGVYAFIFAPHVRTDSHGIRIHNLLRVIDVPWDRVTQIDMRWQLEVTTDEPRVVKAYGVPMKGRPGRPAGPRDADEERREPPAVRDVGLIQEAWFSARDRATSSGPVRRSWDALSLVALAVLGVWAVVAVVVSGGTG